MVMSSVNAIMKGESKHDAAATATERLELIVVRHFRMLAAWLIRTRTASNQPP